jgi:hypothetical protein
MQYRCHEGGSATCSVGHIPKYTILECCLDIDWLDDSGFASCGADKTIHIMQIGESAPVKTLLCVGVNAPQCTR